ncbi:MAG TPA: EAL domain-containing protein [Catenuloplanes sp.]
MATERGKAYMPSTPSPTGARLARSRVLSGLRRARPKGRSLPEENWNNRHRAILALLLVQATGLVAVALGTGRGGTDLLVTGLALAVPVLVALSPSAGRAVRASAATIGLLAQSAALVHLCDGYTETHFHFFVMIGVISLYQDWAPFLLAVGFIVVHHGALGVLRPESVYHHPQAWASPWTWAAIHAAFICAASVTSLISWRLSEQAFHDPLTGFANRSLLLDRIRQALARTQRHPGTVAVLLLDLDNFKTVNDGLGRAVGDQLLVVTGERLRVCLRPGDTAARLGSDEFAVCVETTDPTQITAIAERLLELVRQPILLAGKELSISASIGIAISTATSTADDLLLSADTAMSAAKHQGRGRYAVFASDMHVAQVERLDLHCDLQQALARDQLRLHYQPIVSLDSGMITGVEALVRWDHPTRGMIPPMEFIPLAEENGMIVPLGNWVLTEACRQLRRWQETEPRAAGLTVAVNISGHQLQRPHFLPELSQILRGADLPPEALVLEITESAIMQDTESMIRTLGQLKALGVRLAVDDFGTGYSSLSYLQRFPVDILKIDRSFIRPLANPLSDAVGLPRAIVGLARMLKLHTVAEGIENTEQATAMRRIGCDSAQGFLFAHPCPPEQLPALLHLRHTANLVVAGQVP